MPLKMSKQARIELLSARRVKYASLTSRYKKASVTDDIMPSAGCKNRKIVIRLLSSDVEGCAVPSDMMML